MVRLIVVVVTLALLCSMPSTQAAPVEALDHGFILGGQWTNASNVSTQTDHFNDLPSLVEDYTATWCTNCVDVEHALDEIPPSFLQQYHFHRAIGETEDPFGSVVLDERWQEMYGLRIPPTVVFNGHLKKVGSVADGDSLKDDYDNLTNSTRLLDEGSSDFAWTPSGEVGVAVWNVNFSELVLEHYTIDVQVWFVESGATFEEGSNQLGYYPHIVREIHSLGSELNGTATLTIPTAFDDDDIEVHLMYEFTTIQDEECCEGDEKSTSEEDESLPFLNLNELLLVIVLCTFVFQKKRH